MFFQKNKNFAYGLVSAILLTGIFAACVKTDFDEPPTGGDGQDIPTNTTIRDLKKLHVTSGTYDLITEDLVIGGTVVMDDRSGNYYKTLVIQDSTGGLEIKFNDGYLYNRYPIGRKIYIRCKNLMLTDYIGLTQLVGGTITQNGVLSEIGITEVQERAQVVKGFLGAPPTPRTVGINDLNADMVSTLIRLENVQFVFCDAGRPYADAVSQSSLNRTLEDCTGRELFLRSSGFADFATANTPTGNGSIVGVLGIYNTNGQVEASDFQLYIRDLNDVSMTGNRCGNAGPIGGDLTDISAIRSQFTGTTTTVQGSKKIKGVVISDRFNNNLNFRNLYLQDGTAGILVRFTEGHCFDLGDEIEVDVSGQELSEFNKLLQVNNVALTKAGVLGTGRTVVPRTATVAEINANYEAWESTLIKISNATVTGGATYNGNRTVSDGTGNIAMFTQSSAAFANVPLPAGQVTLTAIVSDFNGKQIVLRNLNDVQ